MNLNEYYNLNIEVDFISYDTRELQQNCIFFCINDNSYNYVEEAIKNGVVVVVSNHSIDLNVPVIVVEDVCLELSKFSAYYYNYPSKDLKIIGYTGTDGKTTSTLILKSILNHFEKNGYIGTNGIIYNDFKKKHYCTTPFPNHLQSYLSDMVEDDVKYVGLEATSQGLALKRVEDVYFDCAVVTNITSDHLDYHKTFENYLESKLHILDLLNPNGYLILNRDDEYFNEFNSRWNKTLTYGIDNDADFRAVNIQFYNRYITFELIFNSSTYPIKVNLSGKYNIYNVLSTIAVLYSYGFDLETIIPLYENIDTIEGRGNFVENDLGVDILIDFAHTKNGVSELVSFYSEISKSNGSRIITMMGCPGRRDASKRPVIGEILTSLSDLVVFTSDDPRDEPICDIIDEMISGAVKNNYVAIEQRPKAIEYVLTNSKPGDIILLLGKGAENKFAIGDKEIDYIEEDVVKSVLNDIASGVVNGKN